MSEAKVICNRPETWGCKEVGDGPPDIQCGKPMPGLRDKPCRYSILVGTFEESGKSYREMYEEARAQINSLVEDCQLCKPMPVVAPDEVGVKPHKRHRPRKKVTEPPCATCPGDGGPHPICGCEALGEYNLSHPESLGLPAMPRGDSEGVTLSQVDGNPMIPVMEGGKLVGYVSHAVSQGDPEGKWPGWTEKERIQQLRDDFEVPAAPDPEWAGARHLDHPDSLGATIKFPSEAEIRATAPCLICGLLLKECRCGQ